MHQFTRTDLEQVFSKYGIVEVVAPSSKKSSALVQFANIFDAVRVSVDVFVSLIGVNKGETFPFESLH